MFSAALVVPILEGYHDSLDLVSVDADLEIHEVPSDHPVALRGSHLGACRP